MRRALVLIVVAIALFFLVRTNGNPPPPAPNPPGAFSFAAFGDAPYYFGEEIQYPIVLKAIDDAPVAFAIHVGDIFWRPCTDAHYRLALARFNGLHHPVLYTPGDNEWLDCWERRSGGFEPQERLQSLRRIFFSDPTHSVGGQRISVVSQPGAVENARWEHDGVVFATIHVVGVGDEFPAAEREASRKRLAVAADWVREAFRQPASAVVISFQADMDLEKPRTDPWQQTFEPLLSTIEGEALAFRKPVLLVHGDGHTYTVDHPLRNVPNLTRLEVPGSPKVGWVRVTVKPGGVFGFEEYVVPMWKYW